jgi:hypothetical protein
MGTLPTSEASSDDYTGHVIYADRHIGERRESYPDLRATTAAEATPGGVFELAAAGIAVGLGVLGLLGVAPFYIAAFGLIAVGFALLAQGNTLAARWNHAAHISKTKRKEAVGIGTEVAGGAAVIVLGGLAAVGVNPFTLLPAALLVLGAALLLGGPAQPALAARVAPDGERWVVTRDAVRASSGVMVMAGVAAIVLGILALTGGPIVTLALVAVVCVAASLVLAGGAVTARLARRLA